MIVNFRRSLEERRYLKDRFHVDARKTNRLKQVTALSSIPLLFGCVFIYFSRLAPKYNILRRGSYDSAAARKLQVTKDKRRDMSGNTQKGSTSDVPNGWTDKYEGMGSDAIWGDDGVGTLMAADLGLPKPTPKLALLEDGGGLYIFDASSQLYMWNALEGDTYKVVSPTSFNDVKKLIKEAKMKDMKLQRCHPPAPPA
ncbi:hypothetical protein EKO27_g5286 [Xylaria grammica]|uniref:Uncharacterized protein n=1 Tax=Xylaria grammica TaxID=363999 RepID=A0A439D5W5_9PEZI|nr:hypothetical protein EKO27_g5286 [Xylaria grammica]